MRTKKEARAQSIEEDRDEEGDKEEDGEDGEDGS